MYLKTQKIGGPHKKASTCKHFYFVFDRSDQYLTDGGFKVIMTSELQRSIVQRHMYTWSSRDTEKENRAEKNNLLCK